MKRSIGLLALCAVALATAPGFAHARSARYVVGSPPFALFTVPYASAGQDPGIGVGGYQFPADSHAPTRVTVVDDLGTPVPITACQDVNADASCDLTTEPYARGCGNTLALAGFKPDVPTTVFVKAAEPVLCGDDVGNTEYIASQGEITLS